MAKFDKAPAESRPEILKAMAAHVPFDGWSDAAIRHAADDLGVPPAFVRMAFPGGLAEMVDAHLAAIDGEMTKKLKAKKLSGMKMRRRIVTAVRTRLEIKGRNREAARRTAGFLAMPQNAAVSAKCLWRAVDAMWRAAGDKSTDSSYYTKRMILGGVYSSTLLVWLNDKSKGSRDTWAFLDRRIENVMEFEKVKGKWRELTKDLPSPARILGALRYPEKRR